MMNFCVMGIMSKCTAGDAWEEQRKCYFAEKSSVAKRCMFKIEALGNHCDCEKAQKLARSGAILEDMAVDDEELELDLSDFEEELDLANRIVSCSVCERLGSGWAAGCETNENYPTEQMSRYASSCAGFHLTASCVICKIHDKCHDGSGTDHYGLEDKINTAQTCKGYNPITNNPGSEEDDIPF